MSEGDLKIMQRTERAVRVRLRRGLAVGIIFLGTLVSVALAEQKHNRYIGVEKCKNCHEAKIKGSQYYKWKETRHATSLQVLDSDTAKKTGKEIGVENPQKSAKCLKCHLTAFDAPAEDRGPDFDNSNVQCEACHGPGEYHFDARLEAAAAEEECENVFGLKDDGEEERIKIPEGEVKKIKEETCRECHNNESPFFEEFDFEESLKKVEHPDPRPVPE